MLSGCRPSSANYSAYWRFRSPWRLGAALIRFSSAPLLLGVLAVGEPALLGGAIGSALGSAAFNTTWLLVYLQSLSLSRKHSGR